MSAFTPAPWTVNLHDRGANGASIIGANQCRVVSLPKSADRPYEQKLADAYLIAAAPSLLLALRAIRSFCPCDPDSTRQFNAAWGLLEAAIAKAEGLQS